MIARNAKIAKIAEMKKAAPIVDAAALSVMSVERGTGPCGFCR
jgi:hypothetical protein